jgi:hypothetical protein
MEPKTADVVTINNVSIPRDDAEISRLIESEYLASPPSSSKQRPTSAPSPRALMSRKIADGIHVT